MNKRDDVSMRELINLVESLGRIVNSRNTAMHVAVRRNNVAKVRELINRGDDVNAIGNGDRTPLHLAAYYGHSEIAKILLNVGAKFKIKDKKGKTPMDWASERGHSDICHMIDDRMEDLRNGNTDLHHAAILGTIDDVRKHIADGVDVNAINSIGRTALHYAAHRPDQIGMLDILIKAGADVNL